jgi:hypothetical protein
VSQLRILLFTKILRFLPAVHSDFRSTVIKSCSSYECFQGDSLTQIAQSLGLRCSDMWIFALSVTTVRLKNYRIPEICAHIEFLDFVHRPVFRTKSIKILMLSTVQSSRSPLEFSCYVSCLLLIVSSLTITWYVFINMLCWRAVWTVVCGVCDSALVWARMKACLTHRTLLITQQNVLFLSQNWQALYNSRAVS